MAGPIQLNPDALPGAAEPTVHRIEVDEAEIYAEVRGSGRPVLLIGAADEDAEVYRGIADRLASTHTVVSYDRRGTGRSSRHNWPSDSSRHADDAAALVRNLDLEDVVVLGASAGGIVALRMALRHPDLLKAVLSFEPGLFEMADGGEALRRTVESAVDTHLRTHPDDWSGATEALGREAATSMDIDSLFTPPPGKDWFARRTATNAESLIRGDLPLTRETFDRNAVTHCSVPVRFSHGTASLPIFGAISNTLANLRGEVPDVLDGVSHNIFYHPDQATEYISAISG
jgi:pimeloyl-ACP methyl ester carboxylesterase